MSVTFISIPAGTMTRATFLANFVLLRSWLNGGLVNADVTAASIRSIHIFRPDYFAYPLFAQHRASGTMSTGVSKRDDALLQYKAIRRLDLYPSAVNTDGAVRMLPDLGRTIEHWGAQSFVVVNATWTATAVGTYPAPYVIFYQGYFQIRYRDRSTGITTAIANSRRQCQSQNAQSTDGKHYSTQARFIIAAGVFDIWVEWVPDDAVTAAVVVGLDHMSVRTHLTS